MLDLRDSTEFGVKGVNYYWSRRERFTITEEELHAVGVHDDHAYVDVRLGPPLQAANAAFRAQGFELLIKDGYRPPALYDLIQAKRYVTRGKHETDLLLNMETRPHASGLVVDVTLLDLATGDELYFRDAKDDPGAFFLDFYRAHTDERGIEFQRRQDFLGATMLASGFQLGVKREYWHFEFPDPATVSAD